MLSYTTAMTGYFGMYAVTMLISPDFFWGPESPLMLPYMAAPLGPDGLFFGRMVGLLFGLAVLSHLRLGCSSFARWSVGFHLGSLLLFVPKAMGDEPQAFTPQIWKLQVAVNLALAAWGANAGKGKKA